MLSTSSLTDKPRIMKDMRCKRCRRSIMSRWGNRMGHGRLCDSCRSDDARLARRGQVAKLEAQARELGMEVR